MKCEKISIIASYQGNANAMNIEISPTICENGFLFKKPERVIAVKSAENLIYNRWKWKQIKTLCKTK